MNIQNDDTLLQVDGLRTVFDTRAGTVCAVDGVDVAVRRGECLGVVGESGSGKSVTFGSVMGLVRRPGRIDAGRILFDGRDLRALTPRQMRAIRGRDIAMTMQDALTALNPALTVGEQLAEVLEAHDEDLPTGRTARRRAIRDRSVEMLGLVGIPSPGTRLGQYPHEFSGGMRQRIMIAIALASKPKLLIADEPTTALDVTVQMQVLSLIRELCDAFDMGVLFITHDLGVVSELADRVAVMYGGKIAETGPVEELFRNPLHPYTGGLMGCVPEPAAGHRRFRTIPGQAPKPGEVPEGCKFAPRCSHVQPACRAGAVPPVTAGASHAAYCHFPLSRGEP